ncbi:MAG: hypothetical protein MZV63_16790 [Marinilabiliales bacterium]|nr:hypothetical protein [Marinilabiliales bacterium]
MLSMHADEAYITQAVEAGATGVPAQGLGRRRTGEGRDRGHPGPVVLQPEGLATVLLDECRKSLARRGITDRFESLSEREREVFQLVAEGHSNKSSRGDSAIVARPPSTRTGPTSWRSSTCTPSPRSCSTPCAAASSR